MEARHDIHTHPFKVGCIRRMAKGEALATEPAPSAAGKAPKKLHGVIPLAGLCNYGHMTADGARQRTAPDRCCLEGQGSRGTFCEQLPVDWLGFASLTIRDRLNWTEGTVQSILPPGTLCVGDVVCAFIARTTSGTKWSPNLPIEYTEKRIRE